MEKTKVSQTILLYFELKLSHHGFSRKSQWDTRHTWTGFAIKFECVSSAWYTYPMALYVIRILWLCMVYISYACLPQQMVNYSGYDCCLHCAIHVTVDSVGIK